MSDATSDWAFARTPKWIAGHLLAIVLITVFVVAAQWQWSRHREVSDRNDRIEARRDEPPIDATTLLDSTPSVIEFRTAEITGTWDPDGQVAIRNRSLDGVPGCHVVTPLQLDAGVAVLVTRGFAPLADCDDLGVAAHPAPPGVHTVSGLVRPSQARSGFGARDSDDGVLRTLHRVDIDRIDRQYDPDLADVYIELAEEEPSAGAGLVPVPPPSLDAGPHLGYTGQWILFALVGLIGYPIVLRRQARPATVKRPRRAAPPPRPPSGAPPDRAPPASSRS